MLGRRMEPPPRRFRAIALILLLTGLAVGLWLAWSRSEPVYRGQPISYWIEPWRSKNETPASVGAAFAAMDERAVGWLIRELEWEPSKAVALLNGIVGKLSVKIPDTRDRREQSAIALGKLGERAQRAVPVLEKIASGESSDFGAYRASGAAGAALFRIRKDSLENLARALSADSPSDHRWQAAMIAGYLGNEASSVVPDLVGCLGSENDLGLRLAVTAALRQIASRPDDCVPGLINALRNSDRTLQISIMHALVVFGPSASAAVPDLTKLTQSPDIYVSKTASNTLRAIVENPVHAPDSPPTGLESPPPDR